MFSFKRVRVGEGKPSGTKSRVDEHRFAVCERPTAISTALRAAAVTSNSPKEPSRLLPALACKVPQAYRVPTDRIVRVAVNELMGEQKQFGPELWQVVHTREVNGQCWSM